LIQQEDASETLEASPCIIVIFGAMGDLSTRKLFPAIYHLAFEGNLPAIAIVGFSHDKRTEEAFRKKVGEGVDHFSPNARRDSSFWNHFQHRLFYHSSKFDEDEGYQELRRLLSKVDEEWGTQGHRLYYLATPPSYFSLIIGKLHAHQLINNNGEEHSPWTRVIIEKPFGRDLPSAIQLQEEISPLLAEDQIYRMDHYLGKEGVQHLLTFRFENGLFEPIWNHRYIDHVQITLAEEIGIGSRASFWEETGVVRDLLQNHLMQLFAMVAMEPPVDLTPAAFHREKERVLKAIRPFPLLPTEDAVRGQYRSGIIQGLSVPAYNAEKGVPPASSAETFAAVTLWVDNERWQGVPFYIRGGKRLAKQTTEIAVTFKKSPLSSTARPNILFICIQPNPGVFLKTFSKVPGQDHHLDPLVFGYQPKAAFGLSSAQAYERMILDCLKGNHRLFVTLEEQLAAWGLLTPLLEYWHTQAPADFPNYDAGTWGPDAADQMLYKRGHQWEVL